MTYTPVAIPLPNPTDRAYTTVIEGRTYIVGGSSGTWAAALVSPLRGFRGPFGLGRTRDEAVEALR